jgi:hypothetical protein
MNLATTQSTSSFCTNQPLENSLFDFNKEDPLYLSELCEQEREDILKQIKINKLKKFHVEIANLAEKDIPHITTNEIKNLTKRIMKLNKWDHKVILHIVDPEKYTVNDYGFHIDLDHIEKKKIYEMKVYVKLCENLKKDLLYTINREMESEKGNNKPITKTDNGITFSNYEKALIKRTDYLMAHNSFRHKNQQNNISTLRQVKCRKNAMSTKSILKQN